jgi:pilus assembly protein CpaE
MFQESTMPMHLQILGPDAVHGRAWAAAIEAQLPGLQIRVTTQALSDDPAAPPAPDLLVAEAQQPQDLDALERLATAQPGTEIVLVAAHLTQDTLLRLMRAGVREVLPAPATAEAVVQAVQRLARKRPPSAVAAPPVQRGQVLSFVSCKGGSGATFVAANTAHLLTGGGQRRVALIDMNLQFGDAALFVSHERHTRHIAEVAQNIDRLDRELLQASMQQAAPGLWVLAAPEDPALASAVQPDHVAAILRQARESFDFVVVDVGRALSGVTLQALDSSDQVFAVLQLTLPFIRNGKRLGEVFHSLSYPASKIRWIVNRHQKGSQITLEDLRRTLGIDEVVVLPNQYEAVAASVNQGVPVQRISPNGPITRALQQFVHRLAPSTAPAQPIGWLGRLLRGGVRLHGARA